MSYSEMKVVEHVNMWQFRQFTICILKSSKTYIFYLYFGFSDSRVFSKNHLNFHHEKKQIQTHS